MGHIKFLSKAVTVCSSKEKWFDCKNNYGHGKLDNF